jgi:hypothetical protein
MRSAAGFAASTERVRISAQRPLLADRAGLASRPGAKRARSDAALFNRVQRGSGRENTAGKRSAQRRFGAEAKGMEARRAETRRGSVHDSPDPKGFVSSMGPASMSYVAVPPTLELK